MIDYGCCIWTASSCFNTSIPGAGHSASRVIDLDCSAWKTLVLRLGEGYNHPPAQNTSSLMVPSSVILLPKTWACWARTQLNRGPSFGCEPKASGRLGHRAEPSTCDCCPIGMEEATPLHVGSQKLRNNKTRGLSTQKIQGLTQCRPWLYPDQ